jgi:hypothetical protein
MRWRASLLSLACALGPVVTEAAEPSWAGEGNTASQVYQFTSNDPQPAPEILDNAYGQPSAGITVTAPFGTGWQDPALSYSISGVEADGAWDLGPDGSVVVTVPLAPASTDPGIFYRVEFYLYVVAYENPVALPVVNVPGLVLEDVASSTSLVKTDILGRYTAITWSAVADVPEGNTASLAFTATSQGALIDSIAVYTRHTVVGEPEHQYSSWVEAQYPGISDPALTGFGAAPDGDGIANGLRYFLGRERGDSGPVLELEQADGGSLIFVHTRNKTGTPDVSGAYEWSRDLVSWYADGETAAGISIAFNPVIRDDTGIGYDELAVTATIAGNHSGPIFARLKVTQETP